MVEALYALAADPGRWRELIDVLEQEPPAAAQTQTLSQLAYGAERVAEIARDATPANPEPTEGDVGVLVVSRRGRLLSANPLAQPLAAKIGFSPSAGGAQLTSLANFAVLDEARRRIAGAPGLPVIVKFLEDANEREGFAYVIGPADIPPGLLGALPPWPRQAGGEVAILIPLPRRDEQFWTGIRDSFGLTAAEVRLTARLTDGMTLKEAAADLRLSVNTLRNQLTSIFDKLAIRRQSELVRSLNQLATLFDAVPRGPDSSDRRPSQVIFATEKGVLFNAPPVEHVTLADGRRLAFRSYGAAGGRAVVMCHGGLGASLAPRGTDELCRELGLRLVCPERPGVGRSDPRTDYSLVGVAADLAQFADRLGLGTFQVCTLTSGGRFGLALASALPRRVARVLMLSPRLPAPADQGPPSVSPMVRFQSLISRNLWLVDSLLAVMRLRLSRAVVDRIARASAVAPGDAAYMKAHPALIDLLFEAMRESWAVGSRGTADEMRCLRAEPYLGCLSYVGPVDIWHGAEDTYASPQAVAAFFDVPPERLRVVPQIGSYLIHKHWGEMLAVLAEGPLRSAGRQIRFLQGRSQT